MPEVFAISIALPFGQTMAGDGGMGWGVVMMVAMIAIGVLAIVALVWLISRLIAGRDASRSEARASEGAFEILERRFAEGDIDLDEYRERRSVLERSR